MAVEGTEGASVLEASRGLRVCTGESAEGAKGAVAVMVGAWGWGVVGAWVTDTAASVGGDWAAGASVTGADVAEVLGSVVVSATVGASVGSEVVGAAAGAEVVGAAAGAEVIGAAVTGTEVVGANVVGAPVTGAEVTGAEVVGAAVTGASVVGANVVGAPVTGAEVVGGSVGHRNTLSI